MSKTFKAMHVKAILLKSILHVKAMTTVVSGLLVNEKIRKNDYKNLKECLQSSMSGWGVPKVYNQHLSFAVDVTKEAESIIEFEIRIKVINNVVPELITKKDYKKKYIMQFGIPYPILGIREQIYRTLAQYASDLQKTPIHFVKEERKQQEERLSRGFPNDQCVLHVAMFCNGTCYIFCWVSVCLFCIRKFLFG